MSRKLVILTLRDAPRPGEGIRGGVPALRRTMAPKLPNPRPTPQNPNSSTVTGCLLASCVLAAHGVASFVAPCTLSSVPWPHSIAL